MISHTRVAIVGGGIMGVSLLYHLAKEGWSDVTLIEKSELTSGSTWHAAALVPHFAASATISRMTSYASGLYRRLGEETGQQTGWHGCGSLRLAPNREQVDYLRYTASVLRSIGVECHLIGSNEIASLNPLIDLEGVLLAAYTPGDGHTDPSGTTNALAIAARDAGAKIIRRNRVLEIHQRPAGEWELITEQGVIVAEHVVNAGGFFSPQIGEMVGLKLPVVTILHQYLVTDDVPEVASLARELPVTRDPRASCYYRQEQKSLLIGPFEPNAPVWGLEGVDWGFDMELAPPDLDRLTPLLELAARRVPAFERAGIKRVINGPITHTPDGSPLLGPATGLRNFWLACGTNLGIALGPGTGKNLAQLMVHGKTDEYIRGMDPRRFGDWAMAEKYRVPKALDVYAEVYRTVHFPGESRLAGRPLRMTPIYGRLKEQGAVFGENFGWEQPQWFAPEGVEAHHSYRRTSWFQPVAQECQVVRQRAGVLDLSTFSKYEIAGPDAFAFLDRLCANRIPRRYGAIALVHLLNAQGGIESEATLTRLGADLFYLVSATSAELYDLDWLLQHRRRAERVTVRNITTEYATLAVVGPRSRELLNTLSTADLSNEKFPWRQAREIEVAGVATRALRISYVGEIGWELHHPIDRMPELYDAITVQGQSVGLVNFGVLAVNALRMEKAYRAWGLELTTGITPIEADMTRFVDFSKPFIGREALVARRERGVDTKLAYLSVGVEDADPVGGEAVFDGDAVVGVVTSAGYGPTVGASLAFAYVKPSYAVPGSRLSVAVLGRQCPATVLPQAAYDPENIQLRA